MRRRPQRAVLVRLSSCDAAGPHPSSNCCPPSPDSRRVGTCGGWVWGAGCPRPSHAFALRRRRSRGFAVWRCSTGSARFRRRSAGCSRFWCCGAGHGLRRRRLLVRRRSGARCGGGRLRRQRGRRIKRFRCSFTLLRIILAPLLARIRSLCLGASASGAASTTFGGSAFANGASATPATTFGFGGAAAGATPAAPAFGAASGGAAAPTFGAGAPPAFGPATTAVPAAGNPFAIGASETAGRSKARTARKPLRKPR